MNFVTDSITTITDETNNSEKSEDLCRSHNKH